MVWPINMNGDKRMLDVEDWDRRNYVNVSTSAALLGSCIRAYGYSLSEDGPFGRWCFWKWGN